MKRFAQLLPPLLLLAVPSCTLGNTEEESLTVFMRPLFYSEAERFESGVRALQGSRACVDVTSFEDEDGAWVRLDGGEWERCYDATWSGAAVADACTVLEQPGEQVVELTLRDDCNSERIAAVAIPDRFRLQVVGAEGLRGRLEWFQERAAEIRLHPGPRGSFPSDWFPAVGEPLRLVPDVEVEFPVVVVDAAGEHVAWDREQGRVVESRAGAAPRELSPDSTLFPVRIGAGERSTLALALPGVELPVAEVVATPVDDADSLEIVVAYAPGAESDPEQWREPYAARAVVRDGEGHVILGAPVEWTLVEGHLSMEAGNGDVAVGPPEYLSIADACVPPPSAREQRRATLRVELGALVDEVELEWTALPEEEPSDEPFEPDSACQRGVGGADGLEARGCGCTTRAAGDAGWLAWSLLVLGAVVRRRGVLRCRPR